MLELPLVYQIGIVGCVWILLIGVAKEDGVGWILFIWLATVGTAAAVIYAQAETPGLFNLTQ